MALCPTKAVCWSSCHDAAAWVASNADKPCKVSTNASAAPLLWAHLTAKLAVTVTARNWYVTHNYETAVFVYRCIRCSTHASTDETPGLAVSADLGDFGVFDKTQQRRAPSRTCGCPFVGQLRVSFSPQLLSSASIDLDKISATLEFPSSAGWHGGTHTPDLSSSTRACCAPAASAPRTEGEAKDASFFPLHPDVVRYLCSLLKGGVSVQTTTKLVQQYMNWLRPLFLRHPDIITAASPHQILMKSSGSAPLVSRRSRTNEWVTDCGDFLPVDGGVSNAGTPQSSEQSVSCESRAGVLEEEAACEGSATDAGSQAVIRAGSDDVEGAFPTTNAALIDAAANCPSNCEAPPASANSTDYGSLAALAAEDSETRLNNTARVSTAELAKVVKKPTLDAALRLLNQRPTYSAFNWFVDTDAVSSTNQWREYAELS